MNPVDLDRASLDDLFRAEAASQMQALTAGLLALERDPTAAEPLEACMRAAHSLKGAARIVHLEPGVQIAHAMEDIFVAAQQHRLRMDQRRIDLLLRGVDLLTQVAARPAASHRAAADEFVAELGDLESEDRARPAMPRPEVPEDEPGERSRVLRPAPGDATTAVTDDMPSRSAPQAPRGLPSPPPGAETEEPPDRLLRVAADNLDQLLNLAGASLVESRRLKPLCEALQRLAGRQASAAKALGELEAAIAQGTAAVSAPAALAAAQGLFSECRQLLSARLSELETAEHQTAGLARLLYDQARVCRMRPFGDGVQGYPRMVRDLGRSLGKRVRLDIVGRATQVDRDILAKIDAPLTHLLRNAVDHGIEPPDERHVAGKPPDGTIRLEAWHSAGHLQIAVGDDGRGIDPEQVRQAVVARRLTSPEAGERLSDDELFAFLFLPGFSLKDTVTEISGRGVGLDVVRDMVKGVRGNVRVASRTGAGTSFQLQLPLTLSVARALLAEIGGKSYAFPLALISRVARVPHDAVALLEGRQHFDLDGELIGLVSGAQLFGGDPGPADDALAVIVVGAERERYGLVVDRFLGERELVVRPLDPRLGKVADISAAALLEDGSPTLIVDIEDLILSIEKIAHSRRLDSVRQDLAAASQKPRKTVLVVDDSLTVRELERKLLELHGYRSEVAVDGMDGWNTLRRARFDLVVTDVDMPRMDGIELVQQIRKDPKLKGLPVMILSYKDREEDRRRGLEAGADYYLTKGSFQDDGWIEAVRDLIGGPEP